MTYRFTADIIIGEEGDYRISFPALPRCEQSGATLDEAMANGKALLISSLEGRWMRGQPLPATELWASDASFIELTAAEMAWIRATPCTGRVLLH